MALVKSGLAHYQMEIERALVLFREFIDPSGLCYTLDIASNEVGNQENNDAEEIDEENSDMVGDYCCEVEIATIDDVLPEITYDLIVSTGAPLTTSFNFSECHVNVSSQAVTEILLPGDFCQSRLAGADGSNACVIISLLMGYMVRSTSSVFSNTDLDILCDKLVPLYCGAVDVGNGIYENSNATGLLHIKEAFDTIPETITLELIDEQNLFVNGSGNNTIFSHLQNIQNYSQDHFSILIIDGMAFSVYATGSSVLSINTHCHGLYGGKFTIMNVDTLLPSDIPFNDSINVAYMCIVKCR